MQRASFLLSVPKCTMLPEDVGLEVAFAGRSNSGKSSSLNVLCGQKNLARTSRTPGRTQHLVVFGLASSRRLVDLPGFGYAKVSKTLRSHWEKELPEYLERRASLAGLFLVMDCRHPFKPQEEVLTNWCANCGVPMHILINKIDKLGKSQRARVLSEVSQRIKDLGTDNISAQLFSAAKHIGSEEAWTVLADWFSDEPK